METSSLLLTLSQLSVALAGFSAIVVSLNANPISKWDQTDKLNLRCLIQVSIFVLIFSLLPFLLSVSLSDDLVWKYGLLFYGVLHFLDASFFLHSMTKDSSHIFRNAAICGITLGLFQITISFLGSSIAHKSMYLIGLFWQLGIVFMSFLLLLYQVRKEK